MDAPSFPAPRPIDHGGFDQLGIGHEQIDVVVVAHARRARADLLHDPARAVLHLDIIAHLHGAIEHEHEARYEFLDDALKAKPKADAQRAREHRDRRKIEPHARKRGDNADDDEPVSEHLLGDEARCAPRVRTQTPKRRREVSAKPSPPPRDTSADVIPVPSRSTSHWPIGPAP